MSRLAWPISAQLFVFKKNVYNMIFFQQSKYKGMSVLSVALGFSHGEN